MQNNDFVVSTMHTIFKICRSWSLCIPPYFDHEIYSGSMCIVAVVSVDVGQESPHEQWGHVLLLRGTRDVSPLSLIQYDLCFTIIALGCLLQARITCKIDWVTYSSNLGRFFPSTMSVCPVYIQQELCSDKIIYLPRRLCDSKHSSEWEKSMFKI